MIPIHKIDTRHGFSLVELSIVLVILGLLTGGILSGQSLIRASELRSIPTQIMQYRAAIFTFRDRYFGLPGDIRNATSIWGAAHATFSTCKSTLGTGTQTCNGDGSGLVGITYTNSDDLNEQFRAWQQLANAGLVEGTYTGMTFTGGASDMIAQPGTNIPTAKISSGGYLYLYNLATPTHPRYFTIANHVMRFARHSPTVGWGDPILKAEESWNIETKLDDGKPATGMVRGAKFDKHPDCVTTNDPATAIYDLDNPAVGCFIEIIVD